MKDTAIKDLWRAQALGSAPPDIGAVQTRAAAFNRQIAWRNRIEYAAIILVVGGYALQAWFATNAIVRLGQLCIIAAALYVGWQLHRRASVKAAPVAPTLVEAIAHLRAGFARQRDALAHIWDWYLLPFVPGFVLMLVGPNLLPDGHPRPNPVAGLLVAIILVLVFVGVWKANKAAARLLQKAVEDLDAMRKEMD